MKESLDIAIKGFNQKRQILQDAVKDYVQDKSLPLSDRWEIFCLSEHIVPDCDFNAYYDTKNIEQIKAYYGKRSVVKLVWVIYKIEDFEEDCDLPYSTDEFKEEILDKFIWSFELDL